MILIQSTGLPPEDLNDIEKEMRRIVKQNLPVTREIVSREEARKLFEEAGETYKLELYRRTARKRSYINLQARRVFRPVCRASRATYRIP